MLPPETLWVEKTIESSGSSVRSWKSISVFGSTSRIFSGSPPRAGTRYMPSRQAPKTMLPSEDQTVLTAWPRPGMVATGTGPSPSYTARRQRVPPEE